MERVILEDPRGRRWTVEVPRGARERMRGLLGRDELLPHTGMLFRRCRGVHTVGMRFPIDVVFLDPARRIIDVRPGRPGRLSIRCRAAREVLEVPARSGLRAGDLLRQR